MALLQMGRIEGTEAVGAVLLLEVGDKLTVSDCDAQNRPAFVERISHHDDWGTVYTLQFEDFINGRPNKGCYSRGYSVEKLTKGILDGTITERTAEPCKTQS